MLSAPTIITYRIPGEVPIAFDTDFTGCIEQCNMGSVVGFTHIKTRVYGEAVVAWNIKDMVH